MKGNIIIEPYIKAGSMAGLKEIFSQDGIMLVAVGSMACISSVMHVAEQMDAVDKSYVKGLSAKEYALGKNSVFIAELLEKAIQNPLTKGIIVYSSCLDILTGWEEEDILENINNTKNIPIEFLYRGPLAKRKQSIRDALGGIWKKWGIIVKPLKAKSQCNRCVNLSVDFQNALVEHSTGENFLLITPGGCASCLDVIPDVDKFRIFNTRFDDLFLSAFEPRKLVECIEAYFEKEHPLVLLGSAVTKAVGISLELISEELRSDGFVVRYIETDGFRK